MQLTFFQPLLWLLAIPLLIVGYRLSLVDRPGKLKLISFLLRLLGVALLVLAMCRPVVTRDAEHTHVVFLLDVSESVDLKAAREATSRITESIEALATGDSWSLLAVGNGVRAFETAKDLDAMLESWSKGVADDRFRSGSQLADALLSARMRFPAGKARRVALFTDGKDTGGAIEEAIELLRKESIDIVRAEVAGLGDPEASVVAIEPSTSSAFEGEIVRMKVRMAANRAIKATLRILHKGVSVQEREVSLIPDAETVEEIDVAMITPGDSLWAAELLPEQDHFPLNNQAHTTVRVTGKPRVLTLHQKPDEMRPFDRALKEQGVEIETRGTNGLPDSMDGLLAFDAIILADVPATVLPPRQMELLKRYVTDFGGGLAMFGSENSYGLGGYYRTPVEEVLPLISRFEKEKEKPSLAMVLVIDKSGSMSGAPIALARQAAKAAVELLGNQDQIGVIGFDSNPVVITELRHGSEKDTIMSLIDTMDASGGTDLYPAMVGAKEMLDNTSSKIKHMIVLSDGQTSDADFQGLTQSLADSGVTVSTVALGEGAARELMAGIAEIGRGRYYETMDPATVPQIFTKETMQASKSAIKEDIYGVVQVGDHPMLAGFEGAELPFVLGFVMTEPKPTSQVLLAAETGDPLLAISQFGLGKGLAYSSDMTERWGGEWLASEDAGKFWAQALRAILRKTDAQGFMVNASATPGLWSADIRRNNDDGGPVSAIEWDAQALDANGRTLPITVQETGLGRYHAEIPLPGHDRLTIRLLDRSNDKIKILHYDRGYPKEYALDTRTPPTLEAVPELRAENITANTLPVTSPVSIAHWFAILGLVCIFVGILLRRL
ncbi:MAG: VWA domain-containing protein [Verrucomicrobiales bacterium]